MSAFQTPVRTVGELRDALAHLDDTALVEWEYDGPDECCDGHVHDVTEISGCDAVVTATFHNATLRLTGGAP